VRIDPFVEALGELEDPEFRITIGGTEEVTSSCIWSEARCEGSPSKRASCAC